MLTPFPGTVDLKRWEKMLGDTPQQIACVAITRRWLIPPALRPKLLIGMAKFPDSLHWQNQDQ